MNSRSVVDAGGRTWSCQQDGSNQQPLKEGQDVSIVCTTTSVKSPIRLTVGWRWSTMADNGLARLIADASPAPKKIAV